MSSVVRIPSLRLLWPCLCVATYLSACGNPVPESVAAGTEGTPGAAAAAASSEGERVTPPFEVKGELDGLLLVWFDEKGVHTARTRSEIPESSRQHVRVESLRAAPGVGLDPDHIYVADLRTPEGSGGYPVRRMARDAFDARVDGARPKAPPQDEAVVVYKASWCGACKAAEAFLRSKQVAFVEKDVEKDPGAQAEMQQKAQAKGLSPRGVPVIDFRGEIMLGFDQQRLEALIAQMPKPI